MAAGGLSDVHGYSKPEAGPGEHATTDDTIDGFHFPADAMHNRADPPA